MEERKHIVILAAGDFPTHEVPLRALREADFVVCCDSAYEQWLVFSVQYSVTTPFVVIGDGDSLSEDDRRQLGDRWIHVAEQDYNDLHKAMAYATSHFSLLTSRFLRVVVPNPGPLPSWHPAPGQPSYLFSDEIIIR